MLFYLKWGTDFFCRPAFNARQKVKPVPLNLNRKEHIKKMQYLKRNTRFSILAFLIIVLSITISISTLTKTEVYFSHYDNPQIFTTTSLKPEVQIININTASHDEVIKILKIGEPLAQEIINLGKDLEEFKELKDFLQLPELINFDWRERKEEGKIITN